MFYFLVCAQSMCVYEMSVCMFAYVNGGSHMSWYTCRGQRVPWGLARSRSFLLLAVMTYKAGQLTSELCGFTALCFPPQCRNTMVIAIALCCMKVLTQVILLVWMLYMLSHLPNPQFLFSYLLNVLFCQTC